MRTGKWRKPAFISLKTNFSKTCKPHISKKIRQETDRFITVLKIRVGGYIIAGNHLMLTSEHTAREIEQKGRKVIGMLNRGIRFTRR